jgi:predicted nucleic acid-binding protein
MFLDTSFCVDMIREHTRERTGPAIRKLGSLGDVRLFLSVFVLCELRAGAEMSADSRKELGRIEEFIDSFTIVYPDKNFAVLYGETAADLQRQGTPIPLMDVLIGVTAKAWGLPLLTRDVEQYMKIRGLVVESY